VVLFLLLSVLFVRRFGVVAMVFDKLLFLLGSRSNQSSRIMPFSRRAWRSFLDDGSDDRNRSIMDLILLLDIGLVVCRVSVLLFFEYLTEFDGGRAPHFFEAITVHGTNIVNHRRRTTRSPVQPQTQIVSTVLHWSQHPHTTPKITKRKGPGRHQYLSSNAQYQKQQQTTSNTPGQPNTAAQ